MTPAGTAGNHTSVFMRRDPRVMCVVTGFPSRVRLHLAPSPAIREPSPITAHQSTSARRYTSTGHCEVPQLPGHAAAAFASLERAVARVVECAHMVVYNVPDHPLKVRDVSQQSWTWGVMNQRSAFMVSADTASDHM